MFDAKAEHATKEFLCSYALYELIIVLVSISHFDIRKQGTMLIETIRR